MLIIELILIALLFAESNNHIHNLISNEEDALCVPCTTKSDILHNIETDRVNKATIMPLQKLFSREKRNSPRITCQKRRKLLNTDKGKNAIFDVICVFVSRTSNLIILNNNYYVYFYQEITKALYN